MIKLVSMKRSKESMRANQTVSSKPDPYPYGLRLHLDKDELKKLGIKELPDVNDTFHIMAVADVVGTSRSLYKDSEESSGIDLQITMMTLSDESVAAVKSKTAVASSVMHNTYQSK